MEGLSQLIMDMGVVHLNLPCNDNAVLMELAVRLRQERKKKQADVVEIGQEEERQKSSFDNLRATLRRKPFKAKLRHPKRMVRKGHNVVR